MSATTLSVDEPGSFPATISVGGTTLPKATYPPKETVWSGGGGGASVDFKRPAYQSKLTQAGNARLVPDIASDADPSTGAEVVDTGLGSTVDEGVGGTSLSSPTQAAELAAALSSEGCSAGLGDIHQDLYDHEADFNDITSGSNNNGSGSLYAATPGYDEASGLGTPDWTKLVADITAETPCSGSPELAAASLPDASTPIAMLGVGLLAAVGMAVGVRRRRGMSLV